MVWGNSGKLKEKFSKEILKIYCKTDHFRNINRHLIWDRHTAYYMNFFVKNIVMLMSSLCSFSSFCALLLNVK